MFYVYKINSRPRATSSSSSAFSRNRKYSTKARNADPVTYKWATAFEALVGYLYLAEYDERLEWVLARAIEIIGR